MSSKKYKRHGSFEDFKAAFICVNEKIDGYLETTDDLLKALQGCGRNPTKKSINNYIKEYKKIGFDQFCEIATKERTPNEEELIQAFKSIDTDSNGYISLDEFINIFTKEGDTMEVSEIKKIMKDADLNNDEMLNYEEFSRLIVNTIIKAKEAARKQMKKFIDNSSDFSYEDKVLNSSRSRQSSLSSRSNNLDERDSKLKKKSFKANDSDEVYTKGDQINRNFLKSQLDNTRSSDSIRNKKFDFDNNYERENLLKETRLTKNNEIEIRLGPIEESKTSIKYPKNFNKWFTKSIKGGLYFNSNLNGIIANSFALDLHSESSIFLSIETFKTHLHTNHDINNMDISMLIVKDKTLKVKGFIENKLENKWSTRIDLSRGRYYIFPFTTGCHLKKRISEYSKNEVKLYQKDLNGKTTLTRQFRDALSVIFELFDLDSNDKLSQDELKLYSFITANEDMPDEEWKFVGDLVGFEKNQLTKDGFIKLHSIEAKREDKDIDDINNRLLNLGFNKSLTIDQSCPFIINVSSEVSDFDVLLSEIYEIKSSDTFLKEIFETKGYSNVISKLDKVNLIEYKNDYWCAILAQNNSNEEIKLKINCSKSENCLSNLNELKTDIRLKAKKTKIVMYLTHQNPKKELVIRCTTSFNN